MENRKQIKPITKETKLRSTYLKTIKRTKIKSEKKQQQIINQQLIKNQMVVQEANIHNQFTEESWDIEHSNHIDQWVRVKNVFR